MRPSITTYRKAILQSVLMLAALFGCSWQEALAANECRVSPTPGINWQNCDKKLLMLNGSDLGGANLTEADFTSTDLRDSNLAGAIFEDAVLVRASLARSKAQGANFSGIEAFRTEFGGMDAPGAVFVSAELSRSNFTKANLADTDFRKADLGRSQFDGADVSGSRFSLANLARTDFRQAAFAKPVDFDRAFMFLTRIEGVDLSAATGLTQWQLDMACGDDATVLPTGLKKAASWPCKFQQE
ncbi:pentapeptide repeat-containing protein [Agrobacterium sp. a22-2]|uniref:pentapeptide repeat-containing protein n=1 Tax=Agrobacterium sp. a22-2 TaxID=2283840 RepID=UPI001445F6A5|nr:pentapeptide repeat-containing protein [Agrobacterium sp. a22-2]NKN34926.1 pentapeptide repeat-containing protein [Agrobacterium sp. a22-2]